MLDPTWEEKEAALTTVLLPWAQTGPQEAGNWTSLTRSSSQLSELTPCSSRYYRMTDQNREHPTLGRRRRYKSPSSLQNMSALPVPRLADHLTQVDSREAERFEEGLESEFHDVAEESPDIPANKPDSGHASRFPTGLWQFIITRVLEPVEPGQEYFLLPATLGSRLIKHRTCCSFSRDFLLIPLLRCFCLKHSFH